ncbi:DUF736 domain-containing protein [Phenylobacterium sp.]|jgi:uncharacterized protein (DUF736 family)|uniref:DUF736 domain-containing protein n=1 Tax=Phenylobacterium sp. TaxID=1871053 RepID=UPI002F957CF5
MATIGKFQLQEDGSFVGELRTLTLVLNRVVFRPHASSAAPASAFTVFAGPVEVGVAVRKTGLSGEEVLAVELDDLSFAGPASAMLVERPDGWHLVWSRQRG